ncbi:C4-dicarboxylate ABC transporter permease [Sporosarcina sp. PTS2304]|uniref:TRAP transporter large permease n=1 Tax=Sporosarcina sp. PTS2304 TaxID=2283194 RepID=UPI000E0D9B7A|nr:TRAP transporter large permease subunit [Sporosarcina sp. PTS2304]AXI01221.1 C4-dicarboxylate ABC transporter permease [Sporosarcina sp. PTS2304]
MTMLILFGSLFVFIILSVPIGIAIGLSSMLVIFFSDKVSLPMLIQKLFTSLDSFPLMAIPFFMLGGLLMGKGGISERILNLAKQLVGWMVGGLAMVTVVACAFFAALSGSGPATVGAIGSFMIPSMKEKNYNPAFASAITAAAGCIGVIIPPSIPLILYGVISGTSIGELFKAGILPGLLIAAILMFVSYRTIKKQGDDIVKEEIDISFSALMRSIWDAKWALLAPIIILGGIYGSIFTPTEASVIAIIYSFIIGTFVHKELKWKEIKESLLETINLTGATMYMIGTSIAFAYLLSVERIPVIIAESIASFSTNPIVILLLINLFLLVVGAFVDTIPALAMLTPILLPIVQQAGVDPVHFGIIMVVNLAIGFITPPFGVNLFIAANVGKTPLEDIIKKMIPIIMYVVVGLLIITYFPALSLAFAK